MFASGSSAVDHAKLGTLDPTMLLNGSYAIRLTAETDQGATSTTIAATVDRNMKVGLFSLSFNDLSVPVAGLPIQILRTYDSRDKNQGDFGIGWTLAIKNVRVETSAALAKNWVQEQVGVINPQFCLHPARPLYATVTFPCCRTRESAGFWTQRRRRS